MNQNEHKRTLRLPTSLDEQLREAAAHSGRSVHAEIIARLRESFGETAYSGVGAPRIIPTEDLPELLRDHEDVIRTLVRAEVQRQIQEEVEPTIRRTVRDILTQMIDGPDEDFGTG